MWGRKIFDILYLILANFKIIIVAINDYYNNIIITAVINLIAQLQRPTNIAIK